MKSIVLSALALLASTSISAQTAHFSSFSYTGKDARFAVSYDPHVQYLNPVISGFHPDPSVLRVGDTYYLVNSSFGFYPGLPIFKSKDLVNWLSLGHVIDRRSQANLDTVPVSGGNFAPQISYNPRNKTYYVTCLNMTTRQVYYVKSKNPAQGWSDPYYFKTDEPGMDTSIFFDHDGKAYIVYCALPIGGMKYMGQTSIHLQEFDWRNDKVSDKTYQIKLGGTSQVEKPTWLEGPHLYHIGQYYYLMCAEDGTQYNHSEVIFRGKSPFGPWEDYAGNPILTQRDLGDTTRKDAVTSAGHADLVQTSDGRWYAVFLACRPYEGDLYHTGRETFLLPVTWKDGWPIILPHKTPVPTLVSKSGLQPVAGNKITGNFTFTDDFSQNKLADCWTYLRTPVESNYKLTGNGIDITASAISLRQQRTPSAIFYRQKNATFTAMTKVTFTPASEKGLAGLVLFQNEKYHFVFGKTEVDGHPAVTLTRAANGEVRIGTVFLHDATAPVFLKVEADGRYYSFFCSNDAKQWQTVASGVDGSNLSTKVADGFIGTEIGLYASTNQ